MSEYRHNGVAWTDRHGNVAKFPKAVPNPIEQRGNVFVAARGLTHAGRKFRRGDLLGKIERDRNGNPTLVEHDGRITKLKR